MASLKQIEADRLNSQKIRDSRFVFPATKAASSFRRPVAQMAFAAHRCLPPRISADRFVITAIAEMQTGPVLHRHEGWWLDHAGVFSYLIMVADALDGIGGTPGSVNSS
jgi:hypothetical protein